MTDTAICQLTNPKTSIAASDKPNPTTRLVAATELAHWPVHPLCDHYQYMQPYRIEQLADRLMLHQEYPVTICRGYVVNGRNTIAAGKIANLDLRIEERDDLTEQQIQELVFSLNPHRLDLPKKMLIEVASNYYGVVVHTEHAVTLQRAADLFHVSKRSLCRYRKSNELLTDMG